MQLTTQQLHFFHTGSLRVIPGTHRLDRFDAWDARRA